MLNEKHIKEVMRLADVIENLAWSAGKTEQYHDEPTDYAEKLPAARAELETYLRTTGDPNAASKWAHLQKHDGAEAIGVVFRTGSGSVGSLVDGRVVWAGWLAHPNGGKPAGDDLRWAAGVIEKYDDATIEACYMIDSTDCAAILTALAEYKERFDSPVPKHSESEQSVNAELLEALKSAKNGLEWYQDAHPESASECDNEAMQEIDAAIARAESVIETPAKVSPCAGHAVQQEAELRQIVGIKEAIAGIHEFFDSECHSGITGIVDTSKVCGDRVEDECRPTFDHCYVNQGGGGITGYDFHGTVYFHIGNGEYATVDY